MIARAAVVAEGLTWERTPYQHQGFIKGVVVDCAMLLVGAFRATGVIPATFDPRPYPKDWMLHRDEELYLAWLADYADVIDDTKARILPADIVTWRFGRTFSHAAIAIDDIGNILHAYAPAGRVVRGHVRESTLLNRPRKVWRPRGVGA